MTDLNYTVMVGRLVRDPVVRPNGAMAAYFKIASNHCYRDKNDAWQRETAYLACKAFGWWAEAVSNYKKGDLVLAQGRLRTEEWESDAGTTRTELVLVVDSVRFITYERKVKSAPLASNGTAVVSDSASGDPASSNDVPF